MVRMLTKFPQAIFEGMEADSFGKLQFPDAPNFGMNAVMKDQILRSSYYLMLKVGFFQQQIHRPRIRIVSLHWSRQQPCRQQFLSREFCSNNRLWN